jgi:predicted phage terminase large subunit-like protein
VSQELLQKLRLAALKNARDNFAAYVQLMAPLVIPGEFIMGRHIELISEMLQKVESGEIPRLIITLPPRGMKSRLGNVLFSSWVLGRHPDWDIMCVSYAKDLSMEFSRDVRTIVSSEEFREIFPDVRLRKDAKATNRWHLSRGGAYTVGGITSGIAGKGAHLAVIDDPLSEQDAVSPAKRQNVQRWYPSGLRTRLAPKGRVVLITTRWSHDDLAGYLLRYELEDPLADKWTVFNVPAIVDTPEVATLLGKEMGSSYWPERWPVEDLLRTKANMSSGAWNALYMQRPVADEGGIFKRQWFMKWPHEDPPPCSYVFQTYDTAFSTRTTADFSVSMTWGIFFLSDEDEKGREIKVPHLILLDKYRDRPEFYDLKEEALKRYDKFKPDSIIVEKKASGQSLIQELQRVGLPVFAYNPDKDKVARAYACQPMLESGRIWVPKMSWVDELIDEAITFPHGAHDDQVDCLSMAVLWVRDNWKLMGPGDWMFGIEETKAPKAKTYWS